MFIEAILFFKIYAALGPCHCLHITTETQLQIFTWGCAHMGTYHSFKTYH